MIHVGFLCKEKISSSELCFFNWLNSYSRYNVLCTYFLEAPIQNKYLTPFYDSLMSINIEMIEMFQIYILLN